MRVTRKRVVIDLAVWLPVLAGRVEMYDGGGTLVDWRVFVGYEGGHRGWIMAPGNWAANGYSVSDVSVLLSAGDGGAHASTARERATMPTANSVPTRGQIDC